jgi:CubicO group peptidase (beta-lactamase class C family)
MEDPVSQWLDHCPEAWRPITLHHLLTHTSGLVHWQHIPHLDLCRQIPVEDLLRIFEEAPLLSPPGERYSYSSPAYVVAAHVVENASGKTYASYLKEAIFEPLGMNSTFAGGDRGQPRLAAGLREGKPVPSAELDVTGMGAGDVWSTLLDGTPRSLRGPFSATSLGRRC